MLETKSLLPLYIHTFLQIIWQTANKFVHAPSKYFRYIINGVNEKGKIRIKLKNKNKKGERRTKRIL